MSSRVLSLVSLSLLASVFNLAICDTEIGIDICSCASTTYEFTFDFNLDCDPINVAAGDAVSETECQIYFFGGDEDRDVTDDLVPVMVNTIQVFEYNQVLGVRSQRVIARNFISGDTFTYTTLDGADPNNLINDVNMLKGIHLSISGVNGQGEALTNVWSITFTNDCAAYPVLSEGESVGWTRFSDLGPTRRDLCPEAPLPQTYLPSLSSTTAPSHVPSLLPTTAPSQTPSLLPSKAPSQSPSRFPTTSPSQTPSRFPTAVPSQTPSHPPSMAPSKAPSRLPSKAPSQTPSRFPTTTPSQSPSRSPTKAPSQLPSLSPTSKPTTTKKGGTKKDGTKKSNKKAVTPKSKNGDIMANITTSNGASNTVKIEELLMTNQKHWAEAATSKH